MIGRRLFGVIFCAMFLHASITFAIGSDIGCEEELQTLKAKFGKYQTQVLLAMKQIFNPEVTQICPSCAESDSKVRSMQKKLEEMENTWKDLAGATIASHGRKIPANVSQPHVLSKINSSFTLSCESKAKPLSSCVWRRTVKGQREAVVIDIHVSQNGGRTNVDGVSAAGSGLDEGKCSIRIDSVQKEDAGSWRCVLIGNNSEVYTGKVLVTLEKHEPTIYMATSGDGIKAFSVFTSEMKTIVSSRQSIYGITYDSGTDKIYWSGNENLFRGNGDGSGVETVLETSDYGRIAALAYDWVAGNIYAVTSGPGGFILACDTKRNRTLTCATILSGQGWLAGITLNSVDGFIYWIKSGESNGAIMRAEMDGSNRATIVTGLKYPRGLTTDFEEARLYWTCRGDDTIQSSNLMGSDIQTLIQLQIGSYPIGIGLLHDRLYWTTYESKTLQSASMSGTGVQTLYTGNKRFYHITMAPSLNLPSNRINHCEGNNCTKACVLTATSFRCVA